MATWKCFACNWDNAEKWEKCAKCGTIRVRNGTNTDAQLFAQLRAEVKIARDDIDNYKNNVARKWEYFQISSDNIQGSSGLANLGSQGWELVAITSYSEGGGMALNGVGGSSYAIKFMYIFKRPITEIPNELLNKFQDILDRTPIYLRDALRKMENF